MASRTRKAGNANQTRPRAAKVKKPAELVFYEAWVKLFGAAGIIREHKFFSARRWKFDFAFIEFKVAVEIEGRGRHQTVVGMRNDCEKYNTALLEGWQVIRFPATDVAQVDDWVEFTCSVLNKVRQASRLPVKESRTLDDKAHQGRVARNVVKLQVVSPPQNGKKPRPVSRFNPRGRAFYR